MHMADALLSPAVGGTFAAVSGGMLAYNAARLDRERIERLVPLMGVLGAFVFAAQMINFAIPGTGSSGHLGGGMLLTMLLGPPAAFLTVASVLIVQCLFFADGGVLALGANIFNMGFFPCFLGYAIYRAIAGRQPSPARVSAAAMAGAIVALELGALSVVVQTLLSGRSDLPLGHFAALMAGIHLPIAIVEGFVTIAVVQFVYRVRPEVLRQSLGLERGGVGALSRPALGMGTVVVTLAGAAVFVGAFVSWFASSRPDGLEYSLEKTGAAEERDAEGVEASLAAIQERTALLPDYGWRAPEEEEAAVETGTAKWPGVSSGTTVSGLVGAGMTALLVLAISALLMLFRGRRPANAGSA